jgi:hypothetical protein
MTKNVNNVHYPKAQGEAGQVLFTDVHLSDEEKQRMREWAIDYGKCVRQKSVRQENTKFKAGTLPLYMYTRQHCPPEKLRFAGDMPQPADLPPQQPTGAVQPHSSEDQLSDVEQIVDDVSEYDSDSDDNARPWHYGRDSLSSSQATGKFFFPE